MKDTPLIVAHLLGGTSGLNLSQSITDKEIQTMVAQAIRIAHEIERQIEAPVPNPWLRSEERKSL
jgi:hypothetical protein